MEAFLKIRGLKKYFGDNRVLDGVDLDVVAGGVTTIIGKSGIGKSVLLKCIANILKVDAGTIEFEVEPKWTDLLQLVLITVIGAYFGGRSLEKTKIK